MDATVEKPSTENKTWNGGNKPLNASYGKMMMWFFIVRSEERRVGKESRSRW